MADCHHCGTPVPPDGPAAPDFCCQGCAAAYDLVRGLGLDAYYRRRCLDPDAKPLQPEDDSTTDYALHAHTDDEGVSTLHLMVEGLHCAACVWLIESVLTRQPGVVSARVNMTTRRLTLRWRAAETDANTLVRAVTRIGYRLVPYDPDQLASEGRAREKELLRCMAVAGFAAGNVMLFSVSVWAGQASDSMLAVTRDLFHWISALIALPAITYAGLPFYRSAVTALRAGRANMDVPISLALVLTAAMSLWETMRSGPHAYFEAATMLLFFLLVGRYLDARARGRARATAEHLVALGAKAVPVEDETGARRMLPPERVEPGMVALVAPGERLPVDGTVTGGTADVDTSLVTGETVPARVEPGARVFAGTTSLNGGLRVTVAAVGEGTLLAEIVRMMEAAEQGRARYVALADRVARWYAPVVHGLALAAFAGWLLAGLPWQAALLIAVSVLIITCPCALALAVPAVQVIASGRLMRRGILVKAPTALERLARVDTAVFDKTGTLTRGQPELAETVAPDDPDLATAAGLAAASRHPLARALAAAAPAPADFGGVTETPGRGLEAPAAGGGHYRLGSRAWCGVAEATDATPGPELWFRRPDGTVRRFAFFDAPRDDAAGTVAALRRRGLAVELLSGDREPAVRAVADAAGIDAWHAEASPADKCRHLEGHAAAGRRVMMVGDGLNDAPALAAAHVSLSPSAAVDVSQNAADVVFQGEKLAPVAEALAVARGADRLVRQNMGLAVAYNTVVIPLAVAGQVTPLVAAVAMSCSSLVVIGNALRLNRLRTTA